MLRRLDSDNILNAMEILYKGVGSKERAIKTLTDLPHATQSVSVHYVFGTEFVCR